MEDGGAASVENVEPEAEPEDDVHSSSSDLDSPSDSSDDELDSRAQDDSTADPGTEDGTEGRSTAELHTNDSDEEQGTSSVDNSLAEGDAALRNNLEAVSCEGDDSLGTAQASQDLQLSSDSSNDSVSSTLTSDLNSTNKTDNAPSDLEDGDGCVASAVRAPSSKFESDGAVPTDDGALLVSGKDTQSVNDWADALEAVCQGEELDTSGEVSRTNILRSENTSLTDNSEELDEKDAPVEVSQDESTVLKPVLNCESGAGVNPDSCMSLSSHHGTETDFLYHGDKCVQDSEFEPCEKVMSVSNDKVSLNVNNGLELSSESSESENEQDADNVNSDPINECSSQVDDKSSSVQQEHPLSKDLAKCSEINDDAAQCTWNSVLESDKAIVDTTLSENDSSALDTSISGNEKGDSSVPDCTREGEDGPDSDAVTKVEERAEGSDEEDESSENTSKESEGTVEGEVKEHETSVGGEESTLAEEEGDCDAEESGEEEEEEEEDGSEEEGISPRINGDFREPMDYEEMDSTSQNTRYNSPKSSTGKPVIMSNALNAAWKKTFASPSCRDRGETSDTSSVSLRGEGSVVISTEPKVPTSIPAASVLERTIEERLPTVSSVGNLIPQGGMFPSPAKLHQSQNFDQAAHNCAPTQTVKQIPKKVIRVQPSEPHRKRINRVNKGPLQPRQTFSLPGLHTSIPSALPNYPQYLGLQPTVKFKCVRCGEKGFTSMMELKTHQYACVKNPDPIPVQHQVSSNPEPSTNFRITRKVYLCSACGTYYENWNLFLHMREVHKRHICLFCLGMFSQAEKLSLHLVSKHKVTEGLYTSPEDFKVSFKGSCFLMCCTCEKMFTEDNFSNHMCRRDNIACAVCGGLGNHLATCSSRNHLVSATKKSATLPQQDKTVRTNCEKSSEVPEIGSLFTQSQPYGRCNQVLQQSISNTQAVSTATNEGEDEFDASRYCQINFSDDRNSGKQPSTSKPKQVLKVKIPLLPPKNSENVSADDLPISVSNAGAASTSCAFPATPSIFSVPFGNTSQESSITLPSTMTNLERTINSVALGLTSEAQEWEHRKEEERRRIEEARLIYTESEAESEVEVDNAPEPCSQPSTSEEEEEEEEEREGREDKVPLVPVEPTVQLSGEDQQQEQLEVALPDTDDTSQLPGQDVVEPLAEVNAASQIQPPNATDAAEERVSDESDDSDSDKLSLVVDESGGGSGDENTASQDTTNEGEPPAEVNHESSLTVESKADESCMESELQAENVDIAETSVSDGICLAGQDVPETDLTLDKPLDVMKVQEVLKECVRTLCYVCVYCSHAKRIAVNGKQLALHVLAEHRFAPVDGSGNEEPAVDRLTSKLKNALELLQDTYFNTDSYDSTDKANSLPYDRSYECFHCHFYTRLHKELYVHNRKMHQKTILLCIMCKSNFYSYSELLCHLCPGIYIPQCNVHFRCCMCDVDSLPSAFRLMVHLRKKHHACDVCLETTDDQQKLSNHVWKHKLHHLCYRCGIAYRNKPDITKHLFWKHGTESVLCKKCLQKKWPHVYHFCIPPAAFVCEECNATFSRAVSLRVHKRLHSEDYRYQCTECADKFISKKLLKRHEERHRGLSTPIQLPVPLDEEKENRTPPIESVAAIVDRNESSEIVTKDKSHTADSERDKVVSGNASPAERRHSGKRKKHKREEDKKEPEQEKEQKKAVDVFDLPPLNLSSESDSSDEEEKKDSVEIPALPPVTTPTPPPVVEDRMEVEETPPVVDGIWDKFQNYKASLEKRDSPEDMEAHIRKTIMMDHDYCLPLDKPKEAEKENPATGEEQPPIELKPDPPHDRDLTKTPTSSPMKKKKTPKKRVRQNSGRRSSSSSSDSSSDSDSSSCSCGTNCSCSSSSSSSSGSSSSSSDSDDSSSSEGRRRSAIRKEQRREKAAAKKKREDEEEERNDAVPSGDTAVGPVSEGTPVQESKRTAQAIEEPHIDVTEAEPTIRESDLDTTETETDEEFYDDNPQKLANELLQEKRNLMLLATVAPVNNGGLSPSQSQSSQLPVISSHEPTAGKKKSKKRRRNKAEHNLQAKQEGAQQLLMFQEQSYLHSYQQQEQQNAYQSEIANPPNTELDHSASQYTSSLYFAPKTSTSTSSTHAASPTSSHAVSVKTKKPVINKLRDLSTQNAGSGSETEARTKRKRMPNRFYGYSSDEDDDSNQPPATKWRKSTASTSYQATMLPPAQPPMPTFTIKRSVVRPQPETVYNSPQQPTWNFNPASVVKSDSDSNSGAEQAERANGSSSGESDTDSDDDAMQIAESPTPRATENKDNLYCYCQCPYDEVSEMIACDGEDCKIEWFHFECVGIMVPPKGQWYCPDCRRRMADGQDYMLN